MKHCGKSNFPFPPSTQPSVVGLAAAAEEGLGLHLLVLARLVVRLVVLVLARTELLLLLLPRGMWRRVCKWEASDYKQVVTFKS